MTMLFPPPQSRTIGRLTAGGKTTPIELDIAWYIYLTQGIYNRVGGADAEIQFKAEKGIANGYASLGATALVPASELGTGTADATTVLYGDGVWRVAGGVNVGTATLNFGGHPGSNEASVAITGQTDITAGSTVKAWLPSEASGTHTAADAAYAAAFVGISCTAPVAGVGFTINARSEHKMTGTFAVRYEWK